MVNYGWKVSALIDTWAPPSILSAASVLDGGLAFYYTRDNGFQQLWSTPYGGGVARAVL